MTILRVLTLFAIRTEEKEKESQTEALSLLLE